MAQGSILKETIWILVCKRQLQISECHAVLPKPTLLFLLVYMNVFDWNSSLPLLYMELDHAERKSFVLLRDLLYSNSHLIYEEMRLHPTASPFIHLKLLSIVLEAHFMPAHVVLNIQPQIYKVKKQRIHWEDQLLVYSNL